LFYGSTDIPKEVILNSAPKTFINIFFLSLLLCLFDGARRKFTIERPLKSILDATDQITKGDFSVYIQSFYKVGKKNEFDVIIDNINKMAKELSGIETLRTDFIANVSHELKTPLSVIQNYSTLLQNSALAEEKKIEYAKTIAFATRRLSDLITNILKLNKLENQQFFPDIQKFNLGEQLFECLLRYENICEKKNLKVYADIHEEIMVETDAELLMLVWNNLFSNAMKFTDSNGSVTVSMKTQEKFAIVKVSDTGCGISPEVGRHIFDKFYQGDTSHATQGNGLGLALVKRVVDIIGGEIFVESKLGEGSTFIVKLRRNRDAAT
jgi:signal transduction histidine kinase